MIHQVFKLGLAKSIHHARVLIKQRHIRVRKQVHICEILVSFHIDHFVRKESKKMCFLILILRFSA